MVWLYPNSISSSSQEQAHTDGVKSTGLRRGGWTLQLYLPLLLSTVVENGERDIEIPDREERYCLGLTPD